MVSDNEVNRLLNHINHLPDGYKRQDVLMLLILLNTGLRAQELCDLRAADLPGYHGSNAIIVRSGKGGKRRSVPVSTRFSKTLNDYTQQVRPALMPRWFSRNSLDGWLFYIKGQKINPQQIRYRIGKLARDAGIKRPLTPHKFRHRFATCSLSADGANIYKVRQWMGHSSIVITEKYLHLVDMRNAADGEAIERAVGYFNNKGMIKDVI